MVLANSLGGHRIRAVQKANEDLSLPGGTDSMVCLPASSEVVRCLNSGKSLRCGPGMCMQLWLKLISCDFRNIMIGQLKREQCIRFLLKWPPDVVFFGVMFGSFLNLWEHFGSAGGGGALLMSNSDLRHQRCPRRRHPQNRFYFMGPIRGSLFRFVLTCWGIFLSIVFF